MIMTVFEKINSGGSRENIWVWELKASQENENLQDQVKNAKRSREKEDEPTAEVLQGAGAPNVQM